jgi:hypothetical protein
MTRIIGSQSSNVYVRAGNNNNKKTPRIEEKGEEVERMMKTQHAGCLSGCYKNTTPDE